MHYTICKDDYPKNTVERIKNILDKLDIEVEEIIYPFNEIEKTQNSSPLISVRVETINHNIGGTNGKGTCIDNARASAYAEYMERLQNLSLGDLCELWFFAKDKGTYPQVLNTFKEGFLDDFFDKEIFEKFEQKEIEDCVFLPFYNIKKKNTYYLPINIISFVQETNGMAAGNTLEEALVQGLSEIIERYSSKVILLDEINLPSIPEEEYLKYKNIKQSIEFLKKNDVNVSILDASLGGKLPVICTVFENEGIICPVFGAHPSLPIAIERTLTEFAQGKLYCENFKTAIKEIPLPYFSKEKFENSSSEDIYQSITSLKVYFENNKFFKNIFYSKKENLTYKKSAWIEEKTDLSNKTLLKFLISKINNTSENIFIRDVSFLGFPSVYIYVPQVSELRNLSKQELKKADLYSKWIAFNNKSKKHNCYNPKSLLTFAETYNFRKTAGDEWRTLFNVPLEYIAFLCAILLKMPNKVQKYYSILKGQNKVYDYFSEEQITIFNIINDYFRLSKKSKDEIFINDCLTQIFKKSKIKQALKVIKELTFSDILSISFTKSSKRGKSLNQITKKLIKCLKEDVPDQTKLKEHLSFLYK